jgi:hypothetical protein
MSWALTDSNRRPLPCKSHDADFELAALPADFKENAGQSTFSALAARVASERLLSVFIALLCPVCVPRRPLPSHMNTPPLYRAPLYGAPR